MKNAKKIFHILKSAKDKSDQTKKVIMSKQTTPEQRTKADTIIRNHVIWSMGAGLIPVLVADIFAVSALQLDMIRQLCKNYEVDFQQTQGKAIVTSLTSSALARAGAGSIIKLVPGLGSVIGGATVSVFAGASTYALGEVFKKHFESGGTILDFDPDRLKKYYREKFEKGKTVAKDLAKEKVEPEPVIEEEPLEETADSKSDIDENDIVTKLKELDNLKSQGIISEEEFETMKQKLIEKF